MTLKTGHVQPVWAGHPWVYAQAVERVEGGAQPGDEVLVSDPRGNLLGRGLYSPKSAIAARLYSRNPDQPLDAQFLDNRLRQALELRRRSGLPSVDKDAGDETNAFRMLHSEGDGLPGLVVDCYGDVTCVQFTTIGMKRRQHLILDRLDRVLSPRAIVDRSSKEAAKLEGFEHSPGTVRGKEPNTLDFRERGLHYRIPLELGHKTGFYLDQRPLRDRVEQLASGRSVLDCFCYVGRMSLAAARGGATSVLAVDSSASALETARDCALLNGLSDRIDIACEDAYEALSHAGRRGGYQLVLVDPPKLAPRRATKKRAFTLMRKLAAQATRATAPGGRVVLSSCSYALSLSDLTRSLALGASDVNADALVLERLFQGADHPVPAAFGEGLYLSTVIAEVRPRHMVTAGAS